MAIGSQPEAAKFRSLAVVVIVAIMISLFFVYTERVGEQVREAGKKKIISEIRTALAIHLYKMTIDTRLSELPMQTSINPFLLVERYRVLPANYFGEVDTVVSNDKSGWYFETSSMLSVYLHESGAIERYRIEFSYQDQNGSGSFEPHEDRVLGLEMKKAS